MNKKYTVLISVCPRLKLYVGVCIYIFPRTQGKIARKHVFAPSLITAVLAADAQ